MKNKVIFEFKVVGLMFTFCILISHSILSFINGYIISGGIIIANSLFLIWLMYNIIKEYKIPKEVFVINNAKSNDISEFGNELLDGFKKK